MLVLESTLLSFAGVVLGAGGIYGMAILTQPAIERRFGLFIPVTPPTATGYMYLVSVVCTGLLIGLVPAVKAYRNALADGLSIRI